MEIIIDRWPQILAIMEEELPLLKQLEVLYEQMGLPKSLEELGTPEALFPVIFGATKDIRDKYVLSRLLWDLGLLE